MTRPLPTVHSVRLDGARAAVLETARDRLLILGLVFVAAFLGVAARLVEVTSSPVAVATRSAPPAAWNTARADIVDRNGVLLATSLPTASLFADPREVLDPTETADRLATALPGLDSDALRKRLEGGGRFTWVRRHLTPAEQYAVNRLGLPGVFFRAEEERVYPQGRLAAHVLGFTDPDMVGLAGVERRFETELASGQTLRLTIDARVQSILRNELAAGVEHFGAAGAAGLVLDVNTGEVLAMASLPDFDPNTLPRPSGDTLFNRVTKGVYEMGSVFKLLTAAMALDSGITTIDSGYDASRPLRVARFTIRDFHAKKRWLSVPEILIYSSNIGAAQMARDVGGPLQRARLAELGMLAPSPVELPEVGRPLFPDPWREINTLTIGFGHGIAVSPLQLGTAIAAVYNGGYFRPATLVRTADSRPAGYQVFTEKTSQQMRAMMRLVVVRGSGRKADVPGLRMGGKTGTAEKNLNGHYRRKALLSSFVGVFPMDRPRYLVLVSLDEPKGRPDTHNYATAGWVAAPAVGRIAERIAPILGVEPALDDIQMAEAEDGSAPHRKTPIQIAVRQALIDVQGVRFALE